MPLPLDAQVPEDSVAAREIDRQFEGLYSELRGIASRAMARERRGHTLSPTALINEVYLKVRNQDAFVWKGRTHFLALASRAMRQVLIDIARRRSAARRQGKRVDLDIEALSMGREVPIDDFLTIDASLKRLATHHPRGARHVNLVEWVGLGGMPFSEAADLLGISSRQAHREYNYACAWLAKDMSRV